MENIAILLATCLCVSLMFNIIQHSLEKGVKARMFELRKDLRISEEQHIALCDQLTAEAPFKSLENLEAAETNELRQQLQEIHQAVSRLDKAAQRLPTHWKLISDASTSLARTHAGVVVIQSRLAEAAERREELVANAASDAEALTQQLLHNVAAVQSVPQGPAVSTAQLNVLRKILQEDRQMSGETRRQILSEALNLPGRNHT